MGIVRAIKDAVAGREPAERAAIEAARTPVSCSSCGRTYAGRNARAVGHDDGRCLPDSMVVGSVLDVVDGVYCLRGTG